MGGNWIITHEQLSTFQSRNRQGLAQSETVVQAEVGRTGDPSCKMCAAVRVLLQSTTYGESRPHTGIERLTWSSFRKPCFLASVGNMRRCCVRMADDPGSDPETPLTGS